MVDVDHLLSSLAPDPEALSRHFALVQDYVLAVPGAQRALMSAAEQDPTGVTASIVTLGAVLLDIAAGALAVEPAEMLSKLGSVVAEVLDAPLVVHRPDS